MKIIMVCAPIWNSKVVQLPVLSVGNGIWGWSGNVLLMLLSIMIISEMLLRVICRRRMRFVLPSISISPGLPPVYGNGFRLKLRSVLIIIGMFLRKLKGKAVLTATGNYRQNGCRDSGFRTW